MKELLKRLTTEFEDGDYAHAYMESHAASRIAAQIYALRKQRGWTQRQLSQRSGVAQERISKIESAEFSSLTMSTLQKFSRAFDVDVSINFRAFSEGIMDVVNLCAEKLKVEERKSDLGHFCNASVDERSDGSLVAYIVPPGMSTIAGMNTTATTGAAPPQMRPLIPGEEWQVFNDTGAVQARAASC